MKMRVIKVDSFQNVSVLDLNPHNYLEALQGAIGGYIEEVRARNLPKPFCMLVDEEGLLKGLPINEFGCYLYDTANHGNVIVGDLLILKRERFPDGSWDFAGLSDQDIDTVYSLIDAFN